MKTFGNVELYRSPALLRSRKVVSCLLLGSLLLVGQASRADPAIWLATPADNNWNNPANWSTGTVPSGLDDALLGVSAIRDLSITESRGISTLTFDSDAQAFTITAQPGVIFEFFANLLNNSGVEQNFVAASDENDSGVFIFNLDVNIVAGPVTFTQQARNAGSAFPPRVQINLTGTGDAVFHNLGASVAGGVGGEVNFYGNGASAEESAITNEGATVSGGTGGATGFFQEKPSAGNATLIANGGSNGGGGGSVTFDDGSLGGTARLEVFGNGYMDMSVHGGPSLSIGSIEGSGQIYLGKATLIVGTNSLSTTFAGVLHPSGPSGGNGSGFLSKTGTSTLTLTGANLYTGGTTVTSGTLVAGNATGSATGTGPVQVNSGTLGGSGIISGAVTVGTGSGSGAFLAPAHGGNKQLTLTIQSSLTFNSDSTYTYTFKAKRNKSKIDKVVANGVTINSGASINLSGQTQGALTQGTVLTVIQNTAATPIAGIFSNLADGGIVNVNGNNLQASYSGGDGNDLTLTVVP